MLYQTDIYTAPVDISDVMSGISVKIHGAAMNAIPKDYAAQMHEKGYHPFSVFTIDTGNGLLIRVSALCDEAKVIPEALCKLDSIKIFGANEPIRLVNFENADLTFDEFKEAFDNADIAEYHLESTKYNVSGNIFPGMIGSCKLYFPKDKRRNTILRRIIAYASYSGVGGKTGQGMGGLVIR